MAVSDYVKGAELLEALNEKEENLKDWLCVLEGADTYHGLNAFSAYEKAQKTLRQFEVMQERKLWEVYTRDLKVWLLKHKDDLASMEAGMAEPNPPHYTRANNNCARGFSHLT